MHTHNPFLCFSYFSPPCFISICDHKTIPRIPTNTLFLYTSVFFHLLSQHNAFHRKSIPLPQPFSQCRLHQGSNEQGRLMWTDCFNHSLLPRSMSRSNCSQLLFTYHSDSQIGVLDVVASDEDACYQNHRLHHPPPFP